MVLTLNHQNKISAVTSNQAMRQEVKFQERLPNKAEITETLITQGGGIIAFIFFLGSLLLLASNKLKGVSDEQLDLRTSSLSNHRCTQCRYFAKNHFINCAVQPSLVLTDEAKNCSDYCPKNQKS
ncbi:hypothetical protein NIES4071_08900 [Calothrix sp. NIES-4071]|nr:hypothetical protein NIES4071_08900 [Calothrix sp. NIES-4071]BAZ55232.1 hypothetical protein NIES4105_08860 [Calothrix sp. NIES-4105]